MEILKRVLTIVGIAALPVMVAAWSGPLGLFVALGVGLLSFVMVSLTAYNPSADQVEYLFAGFKVEREEFGASLAATNIPLVLGILYFVSLGSSFGLWAVLVLTMIATFPFVVMYLLRSKAGVLATQCITLHEIVYLVTGKNRSARRMAASVSSLAFVVALGFELVYGSQILAAVLQVPQEVTIWVGVLLALITGLYSALGGMRAVFRTDFIQYSFLLMGLFVAALLLFFDQNHAVSTIVMLPPKDSMAAFWALLIGSVVYYPFWYLSSMDTWQRQAVSKESKSAGSWQLLGMFLLIIVFFLGGLMGCLDSLRNTQGGLIGALVGWSSSNSALFHSAAALVFLGLISALVSTADTYSVLVIQAVEVDVLGRDWRTGNTSGGGGKFSLRRVGVFAVPIIAFFLALALRQLAFADPRSLFYVAYAGQSVLFVFVIMGLLRVRADGTSLEEIIPSFAPFEGRHRHWIAPLLILVGAAASLVLAIWVDPDSPLLYLAPVVAMLVPAPLLIGRGWRR